MMNPRQFATVAPALCGTIVLAGWVVASLNGLGSASIEHAAAVPVEDHRAPSLTVDAGLAAAAQPSAIDNAAADTSSTGNTMIDSNVIDNSAVAKADVATSVEPTTESAKDTPIAVAEPEPVAEAAPPDSSRTQTPTETPPMRVATADPADLIPNDPWQNAEPPKCLLADSCVDEYLWTLYQRTPKEDTNKVSDRRKVTIKKRGRMVTVTRTFTRLVDADFTWKDPKAAERVGMSMMKYVIGGMDAGFKLKLFNALRAADQAGLSPGITSAFRDDYRQAIASGLKAASNRSYHGGSLRGGYGHGLAADIVSTNGTTRAERWIASERLWKWVDAHGAEFGIARPYLDRDPPHVAPIDGKEYADHRRAKVQYAQADLKKRAHAVARGERAAAKRPKTARASKGRTT